MAERPTGTVTFLFTDVEGSTRLWEEHPAEMRTALERHDEILRGAIEAYRGYVFSTAGDAFAAAFARVGDGVAAARSAQLGIAAADWPTGVSIRVRMGLHVGEAQERGGDYFGTSLNRAARIMSAGHGGQVLVSSSVASMLDGEELVDLGQHRLKDLAAAESLSQLGLGSFPALRTLDAVRHNLPVERTAMVGRKVEIDEIASLLGEYRLVTLLGIGGTGKTRLATAVAAEFADRYRDGVWFVDLVPTSDPDQVAEAIAVALGLQVGGSDQVDALAALLSSRELLVVLDNCEHLTDDVADVVDVLLEQTASPRFLATSREPLQLLDERHVHVAPLSVAEDLAAPAVELFVSAAARVGVEVTREDLPAVARVCAQLDGLPLSVELAAAQLRQLTLGELEVRLDQRFELLSGRRGGRGRRQASLQAVIEGTWGLLDDKEQELLLLLAAFPSAFTAADVEAAAEGLDVGLVSRTLGGLVDRSVVARDGAGDHRLLQTVKLFAHGQWAGTSEPGRYANRHEHWVCDHVLSRPAADWYTSLSLAAWANRHFDDHRAVEDRLAAAGDAQALAALLLGLVTSYGLENAPRAAGLVDQVDQYLDQITFTDHGRGLLRLVQASATLPARRPDRMAETSVEAVRLLRQGDNPNHALGWALMISSWLKAFGDLTQAIAELDEAIELTDRGDLSPIADSALSYKANHLMLDRQLDEAEAVLEHLRDRIGTREFDYPRYNLAGLTGAFHLVTDPWGAKEILEANRSACKSLLGTGGFQWSDWLLGSAAAAAGGQIAEALALLQDAEEYVLRTSGDNGLPDLLLVPAALAWNLGDDDRGRLYLTSIRRASRPTQFFPTTIAYRQLRDAIGLNDDDPLASATIEEIYRQAKDWMHQL